MTTPSRTAFSLTDSERLVAFVAGSCVWLLLWRFPVTRHGTALPFWLPLTFTSVIAVSALCAVRFLRREETYGVSRLGYAMFAIPAVQAFLYTLIIGVWPDRSSIMGGALVVTLGVSYFAHVLGSSIATVRGLRHAEAWCDVTAFPLWLVWLGVTLNAWVK